jgi:two-component system response regulator RegX3
MEFQLLEVLLRNAGRVLTRPQLIDRVWGPDYVGGTRTSRSRRAAPAKIEPDPSKPRHLQTLRGVGYKFQP